MASKSTDLNLTMVSLKIYQALLNTYPKTFRQEYGLQIVHVFEDCCLKAVRQKGMNGLIRLWAVTLLDLIQSVISEHAQKEIEMKKEMKPEDIERAGSALMAGGVMFLVSMVF